MADAGLMEPATRTERRRLPGWALIAAVAGVAVVVAAAGVTIGLALANDDDPDRPAAMRAAQAVAVQQACRQWLDDERNATGATGSCVGMADWMTAYMDRTGTGPQMMWGSPDRMRTTCQQWMTDQSGNSRAGTDPRATCRSMVGWMNDHMDDWGGWDTWMLNGPMMGR